MSKDRFVSIDHVINTPAEAMCQHRDSGSISFCPRTAAYVVSHNLNLKGEQFCCQHAEEAFDSYKFFGLNPVKEIIEKFKALQ